MKMKTESQTEQNGAKAALTHLLNVELCSSHYCLIQHLSKYFMLRAYSQHTEIRSKTHLRVP